MITGTWMAWMFLRRIMKNPSSSARLQTTHQSIPLMDLLIRYW